MKILLLGSVLFLLSCCTCKHDNTKRLKGNGQSIKYIEKYCPNCNGVGKVKLSTGERVLLGVATFGGGFFIETEKCDMCNGTGTVKIKTINH